MRNFLASSPAVRVAQTAAVAALLVGTAAVALPSAAPAVIIPPAVPGNLLVLDGSKPYFIGHAYGTQNYICLPSGSGYAWVLYGPQATLFDDDGRQQITHFLSPNPDENGTLRATWQHSGDSSATWAMAVQTSSDRDYVAQGAIPWLLLDVVGAEYGPSLGAKLVRTTHVQRVNTAGGVAPPAGCMASTDVGKKAMVPYTTDYVFYRP